MPQNVLRRLAVTPERVAELVERMTGTGNRSSNSKLDLTPRTKQVVALSPPERFKTLVGQMAEVKVVEIDRMSNRLILSER